MKLQGSTKSDEAEKLQKLWQWPVTMAYDYYLGLGIHSCPTHTPREIVTGFVPCPTPCTPEAASAGLKFAYQIM